MKTERALKEDIDDLRELRQDVYDEISRRTGVEVNSIKEVKALLEIQNDDGTGYQGHKHHVKSEQENIQEKREMAEKLQKEAHEEYLNQFKKPTIKDAKTTTKTIKTKSGDAR